MAPTPTAVPAARLALPNEETVLATMRPGHPRLLLLPSDVERIRLAVATDPTARSYRDKLVRDGERILNEAPVERVLVGPRLLAVSRRALDRVYTLVLLYRLDGEAKWAARATAEMHAAAAFSDWNPSHFLDVAEMSHALAVGYDWLFDVLSDGDRAAIKQALVEKGLRPAEQAYRQKAWWAENPFNWNNVCNGGLAAAALAVADEEPELTRFVLVRAISGLPKALASYAPDGAWSEGPGYWGYATKYTVLAFAALESALGTDFGLSTLPGLAEAGVFRLQGAGPTGLFFNFADAGERSGDEPALFWLARRYDNPLLAWGAREAAAGRSTAADLLWYDPRGSIELLVPGGAPPQQSGGTPNRPAGVSEAPGEEQVARVGLDARYQAAHLAFFRSAWTDPKALYVGLKGGDNKANHSHLDLGTFVLDALGQRWALDLGPDDYDLPGYFESPQRPTSRRWTYYRLRTAGHNTLTLDGQNQDPTAAAPLVAFGSSPAGGFAIADLSAAYAPSGGKRVRRGIAVIDGRSRVLVQDELEAARPVEVGWALHTRADVAVGGRGDQATFTQGGARLEARLLSPAGARFAVEPVTIPPPQRPAPGVHKLTVRLPDKTTSTRLAVLFAPVTSTTASLGLPKITPLDQWASAGPGR